MRIRRVVGPSAADQRHAGERDGVSHPVLALQRAAGNRAVAAMLGTTRSATRVLARTPERITEIRRRQSQLSQADTASNRALNRVNELASDLIEGSGITTDDGRPIPAVKGKGHPPATGRPPRRPSRRLAPISQTTDNLRRVQAQGGSRGAKATEMLDTITEIQGGQRARDVERRILDRELTRINPTAQAGNLRPRRTPSGGGGAGNAPAGGGGGAGNAPAGGGGGAGNAPAGGGGTGAGAKAGHVDAGSASTSSKVETKLAKEVEEAAVDSAASPKLYKRLAAHIPELLDGLVPDPLDAFELMYDFAGSYKEAWERIKRDNVTSGFAIGLAAYLIIPRWDWAREQARATVSRDVVTQVAGAVGIAENAFNDGLVRGFMYGERHSTAQADKLRQKAFNTLVKSERMPGRYDGDDVYTFGREDVYAFAAALYPRVVAVLKDADRRKAARIESEKLREEAKRWSRPPTAAYKL